MLDRLVSETQVILPKLLRRAKAAETAERLPNATVDWLRLHDVVRILDGSSRWTVPERLFALANVGRLLGSACLSTAWTVALYALHYWLLRRFGPEVREEILQGTPIPLIAAAFQPCGSAMTGKNGYEVSGQWEWVSGIHDADWVLVNALTQETGVRRFFLISSNDVKIVRRNLGGLRGTGSHTVVLDRVCVTPSRSLEEETLRGSHSPGSCVDGDPLVRCPVQPVLAMIGSSIGVGAAEGIVRRLVRLLGVRRGTNVEGLGSRIHFRVGEVGSCAYEARAIWDYSMRDLGAYCASNSYDRAGQPVQFRLAATQIIQCAWKTADLAVQMLGSRGSLFAEPIERAHRDLKTLRSHYVYRWDESVEAAGRTLLDGLFPCDYGEGPPIR